MKSNTIDVQLQPQRRKTPLPQRILPKQHAPVPAASKLLLLQDLLVLPMQEVPK